MQIHVTVTLTETHTKQCYRMFPAHQCNSCNLGAVLFQLWILCFQLVIVSFVDYKVILVQFSYSSQLYKFFQLVIVCYSFGYSFGQLIGLLTMTRFFFFPAGRTGSAWPAGPNITLRFRVCIYIYMYVCMCICTYHVRNNYVMYIVAMRPYFSRLLCVAAMSS